MSDKQDILINILKQNELMVDLLVCINKRMDKIDEDIDYAGNVLIDIVNQGNQIVEVLSQFDDDIPEEYDDIPEEYEFGLESDRRHDSRFRSVGDLLEEYVNKHKELKEFEKELKKYKKDLALGQVGES